MPDNPHVSWITRDTIHVCFPLVPELQLVWIKELFLTSAQLNEVMSSDVKLDGFFSGMHNLQSHG